MCPDIYGVDSIVESAPFRKLVSTPFMNCKSIIALFSLIISFTANSIAQVNILNGDGTPVTTTWCNDDTLHPIQGIPAGGTFSGCGIIEQNGDWYFSPKLASKDISVYPHRCSISYTPPEATGYSRIYRAMRIHAPILIDAGEDRVVCRHGKFELPVEIIYGSSYRFEWSPGSFLVDSTKNPARGQMPLHDSQTFYLTVKDVNSGCMAFDTVTLHDKSVFAEIIGTVPDSICTGGLLQLEAKRFDNYNYHWYTGEGDVIEGLEFEHAYKSAGSKKMMLVVTDDFCPDTSAHDIVVEDFVLNLFANQTHFDNRLDQLDLTSQGSPSPYFINAWLPEHVFADQHAIQQSIKADSSRTYTIIGETPLGCFDTASVTVTVSPAIYIPNSFTPNNDGLNDVFRIGSYGDFIRVERFDIYDRWGKKIWDGRSNDNSRSWDGTYNGVPAETGTYFYIIEAENLQGLKINRKGDVLLLR